jgi:carboxylate-amine ligase
VGGGRVIAATDAGRALSEDELRAVFDAPAPLTIGLEEEVMLVDPVTLDLAPIAAQLLEEEDDPGLKLELPASQAEILSAPCSTVGEAVEQVAAGRERLARLAGSRARVIAAGVHPHAAPLGVLNEGERYDAIHDQFAGVARAQLVCALQIHVAVGGADATLRVHDALRSHLPELAALAANAPFHAGRDTGFASVRPLIGTLLPRQGVPPAIGSMAAFAEMLAWAGDPKTWWFEVRPHPAYGTLELRVCDAQTTVGEGAAIAAYVHALVAWLAQRADAAPVDDRWRIEHNRFAAARYGLDAVFADLATGARRPVRDILRERLAILEPIARELGCGDELASLSLERNGALRQREAGLAGATAYLAERFLD